MILAYRDGDVPVVRAYLLKYAAGRGSGVILDLLAVWAEQAGNSDLGKEAGMMLFGLK